MRPMTTPGPTGALLPLPVHVAVITVDPGVGGAFLDTTCGAGSTEVKLDGLTVRLFLAAYEAGQESLLERALAAADGVVLLVTHVDAVSLESLKAVYRLLPSEQRLPASILLLREAGKVDFKMSCPTCGQKLWVRDEDQGRAGRCPHCKKTFMLPSQSNHLKGVLMLPDSVPLVTVTQGHAGSCRGPVASVAERARARAQMLKAATLRVQVADTSAGAAPADAPT